MKNKKIINWIKKMIEGIICNKIDTWDVQWLYFFIVEDALSIVSYKNQVKNIGYQGTHTNNVKDKHIFFEMPTYPLDIASLEILENLKVDEKAEKIWYNNIIKYELKKDSNLIIKSYLGKWIPKKIKKMLKNTFKV
jgi:hypothetical protein